MLSGGVSYAPIDKVILFGGAPLLLATALWLKREGIETRIYTAPRQAREPMNAAGITLGECLDREGLTFVATTDINTEATVRRQITPGTIGIGMGEAWSFDAEIIGAFRGKLLDFMGIPHPRYRGGAHYSWMIMSNARIGGCNLQIVNTEMIQGVFDSGEIVKSATYEFPASARIPQDYFDAAVPREVAFIREFISEVRQGRKFEPVRIDESKSLYFPRLNTESNGWIDWRWQGVDIERFICAFDDPYKGASTRLGGKRVHIKGAQQMQDEGPFHPFQSGLITRIHAGDVIVATTSGHLRIKDVIDLTGERINNSLSLGARFLTPVEDLMGALTHNAVYGAH